MIVVDAMTGFAHPAIDLGLEALIPAAREEGVALLAIRNSYNCGVLGYHTERIARKASLGWASPTRRPPSRPGGR